MRVLSIRKFLTSDESMALSGGAASAQRIDPPHDCPDSSFHRSGSHCKGVAFEISDQQSVKQGIWSNDRSMERRSQAASTLFKAASRSGNVLRRYSFRRFSNLECGGKSQDFGIDGDSIDSLPMPQIKGD
jgi:hypothetical protein